MGEKTRIGVAGYSNDLFDNGKAKETLRVILSLITAGKSADDFEIVSGYSAIGIPLLAYQLAAEAGICTVGLSAHEVLRRGHVLFPVDKVMLEGDLFGDESALFVQYIDILIRIGGGAQSRREVEMFRDLHKGEDQEQILFEADV